MANTRHAGKTIGRKVIFSKIGKRTEVKEKPFANTEATERKRRHSLE